MKINKFLVPALTITSASCIAVPFATSCSQPKGQGGIEVTEAQWNEAFNYLGNVDSNTDYTCSWLQKNAELEGGQVTQEFKVSKYHEWMRYPQQSQTITEFYKNNSDKSKRQKWDGTKWVEITSGTYIPSEIAGSLPFEWYEQIPFNKFTFSNGKYVCNNTGLDFTEISVTITKIENSYRVSFVEAKNSDEYSSHTFSNYGSTTISDWPE